MICRAGLWDQESCWTAAPRAAETCSGVSPPPLAWKAMSRSWTSSMSREKSCTRVTYSSPRSRYPTTGVTAVTRAGARSPAAAELARSRKGIKACMVDLLGRVQEGRPAYSRSNLVGVAGRIDVNADLGESFGAWTMGADEELLGLVSSANVACGFHAGDPVVMDLTVARAVQAGVALGAHPSHFDLRGFGRREIAASPHEVEADVIYQVGALAAFARSHGARLIHVKPHGALYNQAAVDQALAGAIARATARVDRELVLVGLASSATMRRAAEEAGLPYAAEAFADRAYEPDGSLRPPRR